MNKKRVISNLLLLLTATIWGVAFVAQSVGMQYIGPCTFAFSRFLIGGVMLIPVIFFMDKNEKLKFGERYSEDEKKQIRRTTLIGGICCGVALSFASLTQQYGIVYTTVGKAGFITTLYIIIVPILGLFMKKRVHFKVWISACIAMVGLYMICMTESFSISKGDSFVLLCAFLFSIQILLVDHFSPKANPVKMSCIQFFTCAVICGILTWLLETPTWSSICAAAASILYAGVMSSGVAYTLQVVAQRNTDPTIASLIMSLESVIAALAGWFLLHQSMRVVELLGCVLVFIAIILTQLPDKREV